MYHWEADQEDFLVLSGEALLIVEGQERRLRSWDFVHCPAETRHIIVGAGEGPSAVLAIGAREHVDEDWNGGAYTVDEVVTQPRLLRRRDRARDRGAPCGRIRLPAHRRPRGSEGTRRRGGGGARLRRTLRWRVDLRADVTGYRAFPAMQSRPQSIDARPDSVRPRIVAPPSDLSAGPGSPCG